MAILEFLLLSVLGYSLNTFGNLDAGSISIAILGLFFLSLANYSNEENSRVSQFNIITIFTAVILSVVLKEKFGFLQLISYFMAGSLFNIHLLDRDIDRNKILRCSIIAIFFLILQFHSVSFFVGSENKLFEFMVLVPLLYFAYAIFKNRVSLISSFGSLNCLLVLALSSVCYLDYIGAFVLRSGSIYIVSILVLGLIFVSLLRKYLLKDEVQVLGINILIFCVSMLGLYSHSLYKMPVAYLMVIASFFISLSFLPKGELSRLIISILLGSSIYFVSLESLFDSGSAWPLFICFFGMVISSIEVFQLRSKKSFPVLDNWSIDSIFKLSSSLAIVIVYLNGGLL